jgi:hypothetical protein
LKRNKLEEKVDNNHNIRFGIKNQNLMTRKQMKTNLNYKSFKSQYFERNKSFITSSRLRKHLKTIDNKQKSFKDYKKRKETFGSKSNLKFDEKTHLGQTTRN